MEDEFKKIEVLLDGARGIYIPQNFVECFYMSEWGVSDVDRQILEQGPDDELYWEAWDTVLRESEYTDENGITWNLYQDGDLFAVVYNDED